MEKYLKINKILTIKLYFKINKIFVNKSPNNYNISET